MQIKTKAIVLRAQDYNKYDYKYLKTKRDRMGHTLHID